MKNPRASRTRLLPDRVLPRYAYLPGKFPHPVRDPTGHSFDIGLDNAIPSPLEEFVWGADLFNQGYYWEAHEAWELLWQQAARATPHRLFYKALILLAAAGVKLREGKARPASRHYGRAAAHLRAVEEQGGYETGLSLTVAELLEHIDQIAAVAPAHSDEPQAVFSFLLLPFERADSAQ
jgi:predicted metal-dependent hydrolase